VGYTLRAGAFGLGALFWGIGATEPYWRSAPVVAVYVASLAAGVAAAYALFRREWQAAECRYGSRV
jgi:hypothetical protein